MFFNIAATLSNSMGRRVVPVLLSFSNVILSIVRSFQFVDKFSYLCLSACKDTKYFEKKIKKIGQTVTFSVTLFTSATFGVTVCFPNCHQLSLLFRFSEFILHSFT